MADTTFKPQDARRADFERRKADEEKSQQTAAPKGSRMSDIEWGLLIGAAIAIDLLQLALDALIIGVALNWLIDAFVGMSLWLIYKLKGVKLNAGKLGVLAVGFILDGLGVGTLPLWGLDVFSIMLIDKAEKNIDKIPGGGLAEKALDTANKVS